MAASAHTDIIELLAKREAVSLIECETRFRRVAEEWRAGLSEQDAQLLQQYFAAIERHHALLLARLNNGVH